MPHASALGSLSAFPVRKLDVELDVCPCDPKQERELTLKEQRYCLLLLGILLASSGTSFAYFCIEFL